MERTVRRQTLWRNIKKNRDNYLMLVPYSVFFIVFTVVPILVAIYLSFTYFNLLQPPQFRGLFNYARLFLEDEVFLRSLKNTLVFAVITGPISYFLCILFAWLINELGAVMRNVMTLIFYAPSISGSLYVIWSFIFSGDSYGLVNSTLMRLGLISEPILWLTDPAYNMYVVMGIQLWLSLGTGFLSFIAGFQTVDRSIYEAGAVDGIRDRFQEFWYLTLASMRPQLMFGAVMQIAASFAVSGLPVALTGFPSTNNSTTTIVTHISDVGITRMEMGYACAIATVLFAVMIAVRNVVELAIRGDGD